MCKYNKNYIFFVSNISNIGGSQLYLKAKIDFLEKNGWNVIVFHYLKGNILIKEFNNINSTYLQKLGLPSYYFMSFVRNNTINKIIKKIPDCANNYVESHSLSLSTWAEMVAKRLNGKHFIYNIDENVICRQNLFEFYKFKYYRKEFASILETSLPYFFKNFEIQLIHGNCRLKAHGASECILDYDFPLIYELKNFFTIGIVGRLEKKYVKDSVEQIINYLNKNSDKKYNIIYVGGEQEGNSIQNYITEKFYPVKNINLFFTGFLYPIPLKLIEKFDICIAGAGTAISISSCGIPTIIFDPRDTLPFGILNITTNNTVFKSENDTTIPLYKFIDDIVNRDDIYRKKILVNKSEIEFKDHLNFIEESNNVNEYYTEYNSIFSLNNTIKKIVLLFFDYNIISKIHHYIKNKKS